MSRHDDETRILSIATAGPGWWAVWRDDTGEVLEPVPAWALVENGGFRWVAPMVPYGDRTASLELTERRDGYCGLRYFLPGAEPMQAWASDKAE